MKFLDGCLSSAFFWIFGVPGLYFFGPLGQIHQFFEDGVLTRLSPRLRLVHQSLFYESQKRVILDIC